MLKPSISVIIPTYNGSAFVRETIESVLTQTTPVSEIIVIDDGSTDDTVHLLTRHYEHHPLIQVVRQRNAGTPAARNVGLMRATGDFIAFLDQDDRWLPDKITRQIECLSHHPDAWCIAARTRSFSSEGGQVLGTSPYYPTVRETDLLTFNIIPTQTWLLKRQKLIDIGGFDEQLKGTDDRDIMLRVAKNGKIVFVDEVLAETRIHENNQSNNRDVWFEMAIKTLHKHLPGDTSSYTMSDWRKAKNCICREYLRHVYWGVRLRKSTLLNRKQVRMLSKAILALTLNNLPTRP